MVLYEYFKKGGPVLPTLRTCGEQAMTLYKRGPVLPTLRMCAEQANTEAHRESRPERKLSRLEASTISTRRNGTGREVCH